MPDPSSATKIAEFLRRMGAPQDWINSAQAIVTAAFERNIDPRLIVAVMGAESQFATRYPASTHNPFGILLSSGAVRRFPSNEAAIRSVAATLNRSVHTYRHDTVADLYSGKGAVTHGGPRNNWFFSQFPAYCVGDCAHGRANVTRFMLLQGASTSQLNYPVGW